MRRRLLPKQQCGKHLTIGALFRRSGAFEKLPGQRGLASLAATHVPGAPKIELGGPGRVRLSESSEEQALGLGGTTRSQAQPGSLCSKVPLDLKLLVSGHQSVKHNLDTFGMRRKPSVHSSPHIS